MLVFLTLICQLALADDASVLGRWKTIDDNTGKPKGIVEITEANGVYTGRLQDTFDKSKTVCTGCRGDKKDKPLKGLEIIWDVKKTGDNEWRDGHIMDPENGKDYRVKLTLEEAGKKLRVRGYIGVTWAGRTQIWEREPVASPEPIKVVPADAKPEKSPKAR